MIENDLELEIKTQQQKSSCPPGSPVLADDIARGFTRQQLPAVACALRSVITAHSADRASKHQLVSNSSSSLEKMSPVEKDEAGLDPAPSDRASARSALWLPALPCTAAHRDRLLRDDGGIVSEPR
jgi:hypothetical protein